MSPEATPTPFHRVLGSTSMQREVALTFDVEFPDRSAWQVDNFDRVLDTLAGAKVRATFFLQGRWVESCPRLAGRVATEGHSLGSHSFSHCDYLWLTDEGIKADVVKAEQTIRQVTGRDPRPWFRLPYGSGQNDPRVRSYLRDLGYECVAWNVLSRDWDPARSGDDLVESVAGQVASLNQAIVLLHSWPNSTALGLPALLRRLREDGARFVRFPARSSQPAPSHQAEGPHV
jgi:peptidoglycan/xylan/chitin deacetylase (PgdA/CDA1 family)